MSTASITNATTFTERRADEGRPGAWWLIWLSLAFLFGGLAAGMLPMLAKVPVTYTLGTVLVVTGALPLLHSVIDRSWAGAIWQAIVGAILLVGGVALLVDPGVSGSALSTLLGAVFVLAGALEVAFGISYRPFGGWRWMLTAGVVSLLAAASILTSWPSSAAWMLSIVAGVSLMFSGWSYLLMAGAAQHLTEIADGAGHAAH